MPASDHRHLLDALAFVDPSRCSYQEWVDVGMALHESGFSWRDWDEWSRRDPARYHEGECERKFSGFGMGMGEHVKSGTIIAMAERAGWVQPGVDMGTPLGWDDDIVVGPDPTWVEPEEVTDGGKSAVMQLYEYLSALFEDEDYAPCKFAVLHPSHGCEQPPYYVRGIAPPTRRGASMHAVRSMRARLCVQMQQACTHPVRVSAPPQTNRRERRPSHAL